MIEYDLEDDFQAEECTTEDTEDTEENILAYVEHHKRHHHHHKHQKHSSRQKMIANTIKQSQQQYQQQQQQILNANDLFGPPGYYAERTPRTHSGGRSHALHVQLASGGGGGSARKSNKSKEVCIQTKNLV